jgi:hypothetical protein
VRTHKIAFPNCHFGLMLYIACCTKRMQLILVHFHYFSDIVTIALHKHLSLSQRKNQTIIYGGKRARKLVKSREMFHNSNIDVVQLRAANHVGQQILNWRLQRSHNPWNCAYINPLPVVKLKREAEKAFVPSSFLSNVMSLEPKIDKVRHCMFHANLYLVYLTETWLQDRIHNMYFQHAFCCQIHTP